MACVMGATERTVVAELWNLDHVQGLARLENLRFQCPFYDKRYLRLQVKNYSHG